MNKPIHTSAATKAELTRWMLAQLLSDERLPDDVLDEIRAYLAEPGDEALKSDALEQALAAALRSGPLAEANVLPVDVEHEWKRLATTLGLNPDLNHYRSIRERSSAPQPVRRSRWLRRVWQAAAVLVPLLVGLGAGILLNRQPSWPEMTLAEVNTAQHIILPDSTAVTVEPGSSVHYREGADFRILELSGEAFFKVKSDANRPFEVHTGQLSLQVLGTEFNVSGRSGAHSGTVSLYEGSVQVDAGGANQALSPGERLTYDGASGEVAVTIIPASEMMARGYKPRLKFDGAPLGEILDALTAVHGTAIRTAPGVNRAAGAFTINLEGHTPAEALDLLIRVSREPLGCETDGEQITITPK